jgi:hypothetical protein
MLVGESARVVLSSIVGCQDMRFFEDVFVCRGNPVVRVVDHGKRRCLSARLIQRCLQQRQCRCEQSVFVFFTTRIFCITYTAFSFAGLRTDCGKLVLLQGDQRAGMM